MTAPTLFLSAHDQAVLDMIALFEAQLATATTAFEKEELRTAIASWRAQLDPPAPLVVKRSTRRTKHAARR